MADEPAPKRPRRPDGKFDFGQPAPNIHRPKGSPNKFTKSIKEAMDIANEQLGGAAEVFVKAGKKDVVAYAQMIARTIPMEVKAETKSVGPPLTVEIISVPRGCFLTREQAEQIFNNKPLTLVDNSKTSNADPITIDNTKEEITTLDNTTTDKDEPTPAA